MHSAASRAGATSRSRSQFRARRPHVAVVAEPVTLKVDGMVSAKWDAVGRHERLIRVDRRRVETEKIAERCRALGPQGRANRFQAADTRPELLTDTDHGLVLLSEG